MYSQITRFGFVASAAIAAGLASYAAVAAAEQPDTSAQLQEVVVTAQKRTERLIDVPMSVAAISGEQLASAGIGSTLDLQQITPGVVLTNVGIGFTPSIRGIYSSGTTPGDETNVAMYIDDVYVGSPLGGLFDLNDIERVEVLKGPQGTLFGRNATGGAIRIVTRDPSFTAEESVSADYGFNFNEVKLGAYATGPVSDQVAAAISATYHHGDGYVQGIAQNLGRTYAGPDNYMVRGKLLFRPSDTFQATFAADTSQTQNENIFIAVPPPGVNPFPGPGSIATTAFHYAGGTQPSALVKEYSTSLNATWEPASWVSVRSITGYRSVNGVYLADTDRVNLAESALGLRQNQWNFSQEFNIFGPSDQAFTWLVGGFYYHSLAGNPYFTTYVGTDAPNGAPFATFTDNTSTNAYAGFGDLTWNVTSQLHLTAGARYSTETKAYDYEDLYKSTGAALAYNANQTTWNSPTYRGVIRYDFLPDANVYASWSNGFKSGVYNAYSPLGIPVQPEKIDAVEVGIKARVGGILLTAAGYDYKYSDLQVQAQTFLNGSPIITLTNAASAKVRGMEVTAEGNLGEHLSFNAGANWLPTAEYNSYPKASITVPIPGAPGPILGVSVTPYNASGSRMIKAPEYTLNLQLNYKTPLMGGEFVATISDAYNPGFYWQAANLNWESPYDIANTRLSWTDPKDRYTFSFWITNLTNAIYSQYSSANVRGQSDTFAQPRQVGVGAGMKF